MGGGRGDTVGDGHQVVLTGGPTEVPAAAEVAAAAGLPPDAVQAGTTSLAARAVLVADAAAVLCGDTGVAHLATAYGTPSVLLWPPATSSGSPSPDAYPLMPHRSPMAASRSSRLCCSSAISSPNARLYSATCSTGFIRCSVDFRAVIRRVAASSRSRATMAWA